MNKHIYILSKNNLKLEILLKNFLEVLYYNFIHFLILNICFYFLQNNHFILYRLILIVHILKKIFPYEYRLLIFLNHCWNMGLQIYYRFKNFLNFQVVNKTTQQIFLMIIIFLNAFLNYENEFLTICMS